MKKPTSDELLFGGQPKRCRIFWRQHLKVCLRHQSQRLFGGRRASFCASGQPVLARAVRVGVHAARFRPDEDQKLLEVGLGITNVVARSSVAAAEVTREEFVRGGELLEAKMERLQPRVLAVLGVTAYRAAFGEPTARLGLQGKTFGDTKIWVLPNPSGLNAHYHPPDLARLFGELREFCDD